MISAEVFQTQDEAMTAANDLLKGMGLSEVITPRRIVQKVPLNSIYAEDFGNHGYMMVMPGPQLLAELREKAEVIEARRQEKITALEQQLAELRGE